MQLDARTLLVAAALVALVPGIIGALVWQTRRTYPGRWAAGNLLSALALLFVCLRGKLPDFISIVVANALAFLAAVLIFQGLRRFRGLRILWWPECLAAVLATASVAYFRYVTNDINIRILVISLTLGSAGMACAVTLLKHMPHMPHMPRSSRVGMLITGLIFTIGGAGHFARGIYVFVFAPITDLFASTSNALLFLAASMGIITWSYGFFMLTENATELRMLAANLQEAREQERGRVARELHDELGQVLTALKMEIEHLAGRVSFRDETLNDAFQVTIGRVDSTIRNVRKIATDLRPAVLDLGLVEAIEWMLEDFHARTGIEYGLILPAQEIAPQLERSVAVFRILQEALTNVLRHAAATRIDVCLALNDGSLRLEVRDNGKGISETQLNGRAPSLGILGMLERARTLGGEATVARHAEGGTIVRAIIPTT